MSAKPSQSPEVMTYSLSHFEVRPKVSNARPAMTERGFGRIVLMADVAGLEPWPRFTAHSVAKAGVVMLCRSLAQTLAGWQVPER